MTHAVIRFFVEIGMKHEAPLISTVSWTFHFTLHGQGKHFSDNKFMVIILLPEIGQKMKVSEKSIHYQYKGEDTLGCLFKGYYLTGMVKGNYDCGNNGETRCVWHCQIYC